MNGLVRLINGFPFAGKPAIRRLIFDMYQSTTAVERRRRYLQTMGWLIVFALLHAGQATMGIYALGFNAPIWVKIIDVLYVAANVGVVIAQIQLCFRATRFFFRFRDLFSKTNRNYTDYSDAAAGMMVALTLVGQAIFLFPWFWYLNS